MPAPRPLALAALALLCLAAPASSAQEAPGARRDWGQERRLRILAVGDVIPHETVLNAAKNAESPDGHDFRGMLAGIRSIVLSASLAICNLETTMTGDGSYAGYPSFDSPPSVAEALAWAGFDVACTANNHMFDQGPAGFDATPALVAARGLIPAGTRLAGQPRYAMALAEGVKVAVIAFTYAEMKDGAPAFNSFAPDPARLSRVNWLNEADPARAGADFAAIAAEARAAGARLVIGVMHWGTEYAPVPGPRVRALAAAVAAAGADAIFGSHPHVIQPFEYILAPDGRAVPVFFSLGNFLSNQRRDTVDNCLTEDGLMAMVDFRVPDGPGPAVMEGARALPTWVLKVEPPALDFSIIPLKRGFRADPALAPLLPDLELSLAATMKALGGASYDASTALFFFPAPEATIPSGGTR